MKVATTHVCLFLLVVVCSLSLNTRIAMGAYDSFPINEIDSEKWSDLEFVRKIDSVSGKLVLKVRSTTTRARNRLLFAEPETVNTIKATLSVVNIELSGDHRADAYVGGFFYNTQSAGGSTGDIWANVALINYGSGLSAVWSILRMTDDNNDNSVEIDSGQLFSPGQLNYNTPYSVEIIYNGTNSFTFKVAGNSATSNGPARRRPPVTKFKGFHLGLNADTNTGEGYISATVDDVYINNAGTVFDNFSSALLNQSKWRSLEFVREICNGKLCLETRAENAAVNNRIYMKDPDENYLESKVLFESGSFPPPSGNNNCRARLAAAFYNDTYGPGSGRPYNGYIGNVYGFIRIILRPGNRLVAVGSVWRENDSDSLFWEEFQMPIQFDTFYTMSIKFTGSEFIFKFNNETLRYTAGGPFYRPFNGQMRRLEVQSIPGTNEIGYVKAQFDDVRITPNATILPSINILMDDQ